MPEYYHAVGPAGLCLGQTVGGVGEYSKKPQLLSLAGNDPTTESAWPWPDGADMASYAHWVNPTITETAKTAW
jgi:hypothetical protein